MNTPKQTVEAMRKEIEAILNEPIVRTKYGKCPHCSFKTKSYIIHKNNSIAQHIRSNHPEVPDKVDKIMALLNPVEKPKQKGICQCGHIKSAHVWMTENACENCSCDYYEPSPNEAPKGEAKNPIKITRICFEADIVAEVYDYGQGVSMMKVFEMINKGELKIKTPDIVLTKPVIIFKDKIL